MDYKIDSAEFVASYAKGEEKIYAFSIFGILITIFFLISYIIKGIYTVPNSHEMGQIMPHIFALKMPALILFPSYL